MKTFTLSLLAALVSSPLAAENINKTWELGVFGDYVKSSTIKESKAEWQYIEAGQGLGIDLQRIINEQWNARIELARDRYDTDNGNNTEYGTRFGLDAIYKVQDTGLYLLAGVKRFNNVQSYNALNVGAGYNLDISERFSLFSEAVVYRDINNGYTDQGFKLGVRYAFGDTKPAPVVRKAVAPTMIIVDNDNDGVNDEKDRCKNTPANVKVDSLGCTLYSEKTVEVNLNVTFENNSSQVKSEMTNDIQRLADFMKAYPNTNVVIEGHSSAVGDEQYNLTLSQKRANAVKKTLMDDFAIDASRLTAKGFGEMQLISTDNTPAAHSANRRVMAKIATTVKEEIKK